IGTASAGAVCGAGLLVPMDLLPAMSLLRKSARVGDVTVTKACPSLHVTASFSRRERACAGCYHRRARAAGAFTYAEHQTAEEARPDRRRRAAREPALRVDGEDAHASPEGRGRRRRC